MPSSPPINKRWNKRETLPRPYRQCVDTRARFVEPFAAPPLSLLYTWSKLWWYIHIYSSRENIKARWSNNLGSDSIDYLRKTTKREAYRIYDRGNAPMHLIIILTKMQAGTRDPAGGTLPGIMFISPWSGTLRLPTYYNLVRGEN